MHSSAHVSATVQLAMVATLVVVNMSTLTAAITHCRESNRLAKISPFALALFVMCIVLGVCYAGQLVGRIVTSMTSLNCLERYDTELDDITMNEGAEGGGGLTLYYPEIFYPFQVRGAHLLTCGFGVDGVVYGIIW